MLLYYKSCDYNNIVNIVKITENRDRTKYITEYNMYTKLKLKITKTICLLARYIIYLFKFYISSSTKLI